MMSKYNCRNSLTKEAALALRPDEPRFSRLIGAAPEGSLRPCGFVSLTFFLDHYFLWRNDGDNSSGGGGVPIELDFSDITLPGDDVVFEREEKSENARFALNERGEWVVDPQGKDRSEHATGPRVSWVPRELMMHFKNWYRMSAASITRNLWAKVRCSSSGAPCLKKGNYTLTFRDPETGEVGNGR